MPRWYSRVWQPWSPLNTARAPSFLRESSPRSSVESWNTLCADFGWSMTVFVAFLPPGWATAFMEISKVCTLDGNNLNLPSSIDIRPMGKQGRTHMLKWGPRPWVWLTRRKNPQAFAEQGRWGCLRDALWTTDLFFVSTESIKCSLERILMIRLQTFFTLLNQQRVAWEYVSSSIPSATAVQEKLPASPQQLHKFSEMMASRDLAVVRCSGGKIPTQIPLWRLWPCSTHARRSCQVKWACGCKYLYSVHMNHMIEPPQGENFSVQVRYTKFK